MPTPRSHADVELLAKLVLGQLPVAEAERLAVEYADDSRLAELAEAVADSNDTLIDSLRNHQTLDDANADQLVGRLIARLQGAAKSKSPLDDDTLGYTPSAAPAGQAMPDRLEYFRIEKVLGQGGMGTVYLADDTRLGRKVALKTLKRELAENPAAKDRFLREARSAAKLHHDHIIPIYYVGESDGTPFLAMPFLQGEPLDDRIKREGAGDTDPGSQFARAAGQHKPLRITEALRIAAEVASGLASAHAQGLIHRDIKPANVWLEAPKGRAKILDFGLARSQEEAVHLTASGAILGTPAYMAPEQARGKPVDGRADLFSLGVMLYEMTTGRRPFIGGDTMAILTSLALDDPTPPKELNPALPKEVSDYTLQLLEKSPEKRPADAGVVAEALIGLQMRTSRPFVEALPAAVPSITAVDPWGGIDDEAAPAASISRPTKKTERVPRAAKVPAKPAAPPRKGSGLKAAVAAAVLLLIGGGFAAYKLVLETKDGTLIVEVDGDADVRFKNGELQLFDADGKVKYTLKPGERNKAVAPGHYKVAVMSADGVKLETDKFEMTKAGQVTLRVTAGPAAVAAVAKADGKGPPVLAKADPAAPNYALKFNGPGEYVHVIGVKVDVSRPWTAEAWVNCPDPKLAVGEHIFVLSCAKFILMLGNFPDKGIRWCAKSAEDPDMNLFQFPAQLDQWVHLAAVHDGRTVTLFVDGAPQTIPNRAKLPKEEIETNLGPSAYAATEGRPGFRGAMDEIRISSVARYTAKFTPQRRFEPDDKTVGLAHCDEGEGDVLKDSSGNNHHGTIVGAKWVAAEVAPATADPDRTAAEWALKIGGVVNVLAGGQSVHVATRDQLPAAPFVLTEIAVENKKFTPADLDALRGLKNPLIMMMARSGVTDAHLERLKGVRLRNLGLAGNPATDDGLKHLDGQIELSWLWLNGTKVTDAGLRYCKALTAVEWLILAETGVTDAGMEHLSGLTKLSSLHLSGTKVGDKGLAALKGLKALVVVDLQGTPFTDAGLEHLAALPNLRDAVLSGTNVTAAGVKKLAAARPGCKISWDGGLIEPKK